MKRFGVTEVFRSDNSEHVDIVFVHGVNGHPYYTWNSEKNKVFWPAQLLPSTIEEKNARMLVFGYDADAASLTVGASKDKIHHHAEQLVATLWANRRKEKATENPIVFVGHSLGGLIIKRALIYSSEVRGNHTNHYRSISVSTYGILFLGTPHLGSDIAKWGFLIEKTSSTASPSTLSDPQAYLINVLKTNSETLHNIDRQFAQLASKFCIYYFHEGKPTNIGGIWQCIVDAESASPNTPDVERAVIQQDHAHMPQFEGSDSPGFELVAEAIDRYTTEAPAKVRSRWEIEKSERHTRIRANVEELLPGTTNDEVYGSSNLVNQASGSTRACDPMSSSTAPPAVSPPKCLYLVQRERVKDFFGRTDQLQQISSHFSTGSSQLPNVLILHALGGQGKSQIALEYCQRSRKQYRGIFWVNASSEALALQSYTEIAMALNDNFSASLGDGEKAIKFVKESLESWSEQWLIAFDNYDDPDHFRVQRFFPKSKRSVVCWLSQCISPELLNHTNPPIRRERPCNCNQSP